VWSNPSGFESRAAHTLSSILRDLAPFGAFQPLYSCVIALASGRTEIELRHSNGMVTRIEADNDSMRGFADCIEATVEGRSETPQPGPASGGIHIYRLLHDPDVVRIDTDGPEAGSR
jgi:hypothetical protein